MISNKYIVKTPVLLIGFNRPDIIQQNIDNLRQFFFEKFYVAIDGPRAGNETDESKVPEVQSIVKELDCCDKVFYRFNEKNLGAEVTVSSAISWVLEQEDSVIVLEDDIIAHRSFFQFMQDMLELYKDDERVAMISGCNYTPFAFPNNEDYCFCQCGHTSCGWATWKRAWEGYDLLEEIKDEYLNEGFLLSISPNKAIAKQRKKHIQALKDNHIVRNWDVMFGFYRNTRKMLSIVPRVNLASNIGVIGLHQRGVAKCNYHPIDEDFVASNHPIKVVWNKDYDVYHYMKWMRDPLWRRIKKQIKRIIRKSQL